MASGDKYEFGVIVSQVGKPPPPGGGSWPQIRLQFGTAPTQEEARENLLQMVPAFDLFLMDTNLRLGPLLGFTPFPDRKTFYQPIGQV